MIAFEDTVDNVPSLVETESFETVYKYIATVMLQCRYDAK